MNYCYELAVDNILGHLNNWVLIRFHVHGLLILVHKVDPLPE